MKLGDAIKKYRDDHKMSMQAFADASHLSKGYISMLEKHKNPQSSRELVPSMQTYSKVASAMGLDLNSLLSLLDEDTLVSVNSDDHSESLTPTEHSLVDSFRNLNEEGQSKVQSYIDDLLSTGKYIKSDFSELVEEE